MEAKKCVKWSKDSLLFFESHDANSVDLYLIISYNCISQSGRGLEELVNAINSDGIREKVRKLNILDTSYLYRHTIPAFLRYEDPNIPTQWFLENKEILKKLEVETVLEFWSSGINSELFKKWHKQILLDYNGDEDRKGLVQSFRDAVIADAAIASYKMKSDLNKCIDFILEECAHTCAYFGETTNLVYPMKITRALSNVSERYKKNINHLRYRASVQAHNNIDELSIDLDGLNREIVSFMKEKVTNVNFFVMDKEGNHIYKNYAYDSIVGNVMNFERFDPKSWKTSLEVMNTRKQMIVEEEYSGNHYLSVKAPLIIDDDVKGIIGLAIDITDRKKSEELERKNELQRLQLNKQAEFKTFVGQVAHDIIFPISALETFVNRNELPGKEHIALREVISKIKNIGGLLLDRYKQGEKVAYDLKEQHVLVPLILSEIVDQKRAQINNDNIKINFSFDSSDNFSFIIGDQVTFGRMVSNLLNNAVESMREGLVEIFMKNEGEEIKLIFQDNGIGMPLEMLEKINNRLKVGTTKKTGSGLGLEQVMKTVAMYNGNLEVSSERGVGTRFTISFPKASKPDYIADEIILEKGTTVIVLDDDSSIFPTWEEKLKNYKNEIELKFFTHHAEARKFIDFFFCNDRRKLFLFSDYDLRGQCTDGLWFVLENKMQDRALLVTGVHNDLTFQEKIENSKLKILPKQFLSTVSVKVS